MAKLKVRRGYTGSSRWFLVCSMSHICDMFFRASREEMLAKVRTSSDVEMNADLVKNDQLASSMSK